MLKFTLNQACTDTSLPLLLRDQLLLGANNGVLSLYDIANSYSYDQTTGITNGKAFNDITESGDNGSVVIASGQSLAVAGNGVKYNDLTAKNSFMGGNAGPLADLWGGGTGNQYFMYCVYMKLPIKTDWNDNAALEAMVQFASTAGDYSSHSDLLLIAQSNASDVISFRRQKAAATVDILTLTPKTADYGSFVQLAFWRNATGQYVRLKSANGEVSNTGVVSTANTQDFSADYEKVGHVGDFVGSADAVKWKYYRSFLENLTTSGREPATVLDADYARTIARGVFS